jgi:putative effector of murein hydrolase LrgA (UPF0299 family)
MLGSIQVATSMGFAGSLPYGIAVSQFGGRMPFTLVGMQMLVALLALRMLRSREFEDGRRGGT